MQTVFTMDVRYFNLFGSCNNKLNRTSTTHETTYDSLARELEDAFKSEKIKRTSDRQKPGKRNNSIFNISYIEEQTCTYVAINMY